MMLIIQKAFTPNRTFNIYLDHMPFVFSQFFLLSISVVVLYFCIRFQILGLFVIDLVISFSVNKQAWFQTISCSPASRSTFACLQSSRGKKQQDAT